MLFRSRQAATGNPDRNVPCHAVPRFDASAHLSEETHGATTAAARGLWQSILYSAVGGWILLLAFLFVAKDVDFINDPARRWFTGPRRTVEQTRTEDVPTEPFA